MRRQGMVGAQSVFSVKIRTAKLSQGEFTSPLSDNFKRKILSRRRAAFPACVDVPVNGCDPAARAVFPLDRTVRAVYVKSAW